jgi:hypothetical protein
MTLGVDKFITFITKVKVDKLIKQFLIPLYRESRS